MLLLVMCALAVYLVSILPKTPAQAPQQLPAQAATPTPSPFAGADTGLSQPAATTDVSPTVPVKPVPSATARPIQGDVEALLAQMTLEQKVGQMIMGVLPAETVSGEGERMIREHFIGGIIYYHENINDPGQAAALSQDLQALAAENTPAIPLIIAMDFEGGRKDRFDSGATTFPYLMALGAVDSPELANRVAAAAARQLLGSGIHMSLGPVMDANIEPGNPVIGLRSFGSDPQKVARLGQAYLSGLQENGVIAVAKHFPGHGDTQVDSHGEIPFINKDLPALELLELVPFARAINQQVGGILAGHIANLSLDPQGYPATLSPALVDGLLREKMGYQGVVITDGMMMGAIRAHYQPEEAALRAVQAGCDILLYTNPNWAIDAKNQIVGAVQNGVIAQERIDASARRILTLKAQYGLLAFPLPEPPAVSLAEDDALAEEVARLAITARMPMDFPVLSPGKVLVISPDVLPTGATQDDGQSLLGDLLSQRGFDVDEWIYPVQEREKIEEITSQALSRLEPGEAVIAVTWNAGLRLSYSQDGYQDRMVQAVAATGNPAVYVAAGLPYDLSLYPPGAPAMATYGLLDIQLKALVEALLAESPPPGVLPVRLPE
jgi:beta-N-acetylhexosaminidase